MIYASIFTGEVNIRKETIFYNQIFTVITYFILVLIVMLYFIIKLKIFCTYILINVCNWIL